MICEKCGSVNKKKSLFCNKCGAKLVFHNEEEDKGFIEVIDKLKLFNSKKNIIIPCSVLLIIIFIVGVIIYFNNPMLEFKKEFRNNKYVEAIIIYNNKIKGDSDKENEINSFLKDEVAKIEKSFIDEEISYDKAKNKLEIIGNTGLVLSDVNYSTNKINSFNNSKIAFKEAEEFLKNNDLVNALKEYKKVIADDKNFTKAKEQIKNNEKKYKEQVLKIAEDSSNAKDYEKSISVLKEATSLISNDRDLLAKLSVYEKQLEEKTSLEKKQKAEKVKTEQLVIVESAQIIVQDTRYKTLYPDLIQVIVKNMSNKTIKHMRIGCLGYDNNGYPLKIKTQHIVLKEDYECIAYGEDVNIIPGGRYGEDVGWGLDENHGISKVLACVHNVTFYDGTTWKNPYYEYWIEQHKEKPIN
ncbi:MULTISPECIES: DUF5780 domain-containing protein [unclassified Clostridium]|uniref:DUF5780 domain-containing protein n=1 Tax=unclassified Clostridium TaxID=2614128 RepID=UPI0025BE5D08|nr:MULTISPECIES: DUF5780 domain-containing protein [unclassified Clostridium]